VEFGGYFRAFWNTKAFKSQFRNFIIIREMINFDETILL
jgi:hypothetical protein